MEMTDTPDDIPGSDEEWPDFTEWDDPDAVLRDVPIRERVLDVIVQVREPTKVATIADRADCDTETARDYLQWFASLGLVREHSGRPVRYERNESYLRWRRVERIREDYSEEEIREELQRTVRELATYRERFDAERPSEVSVLAVSRERPLEEVWEALAEWRTLARRAELLDAARRAKDAASDVAPVDV